MLLLLFSCSVVSDSLPSHGLQHTRLPCPSPSPGVLLKLIFTELMMPSNHLILCRPLLLCLQSFPASGSFLMSWLFSNELPKFWSFSFSISPFNEYSGLIFYRTDWIDLLAVQRTLRSLLQHHSSKATLLQR